MADPLTQPPGPLSLPHMLDADTGAWFTDDRAHRLALWRRWNPILPAVLFIGLNPSRGGETGDDPTLRRMIRFAVTFGYGRMYVANLFTLVTPYPKELQRRRQEVVAVGADVWLMYMANRCSTVIACWGCEGWNDPRARVVLNLLNRPVMCLGVNEDGTPRHPLYLPKDTTPILYWRPVVAAGASV